MNMVDDRWVLIPTWKFKINETFSKDLNFITAAKSFVRDVILLFYFSKK